MQLFGHRQNRCLGEFDLTRPRRPSSPGMGCRQFRRDKKDEFRGATAPQTLPSHYVPLEKNQTTREVLRGHKLRHAACVFRFGPRLGLAEIATPESQRRDTTSGVAFTGTAYPLNTRALQYLLPHLGGHFLAFLRKPVSGPTSTYRRSHPMLPPQLTHSSSSRRGEESSKHQGPTLRSGLTEDNTPPAGQIVQSPATDLLFCSALFPAACATAGSCHCRALSDDVPDETQRLPAHSSFRPTFPSTPGRPPLPFRTARMVAD